MGSSSMEKLLDIIFWCWSFVLMILFAFIQGMLLLFHGFMKRLPTQRLDHIRVVVIGGGFAGVAAAKKLEQYFNVTLVDKKKYFEFTPSLLRTFVDPEHAGLIQVEFSNFLERTYVINQTVTEVTQKEVVTANNNRLPYDYLVLASGSSYAPSGDNPIVVSGRDCAPTFNHNAIKIQKANKILIVGGGIVGIELAGEIIEKYPTKQLIILTSSDRLLPRCPARAIRYTENFFRERGTQIILNERLEKSVGNLFYTSSGRQPIEADLAFYCLGIVPNTQFLKKSCFEECVDEKGFLIVNEFLQLGGHNNIFVAGDLTAIKEEKLAQGAEDG
eukprot:TRINITY_DN10935_c0_g1_i2.p1 TRINITY_DN10935_c0_g1~~TRINITY_DN10935_c0_g1_i2.p1  ORF type:complete len:330 (+),score=93.46 TRINITY_DN10935_c0_g1_i2:235-1224(+)